MSDIDTAFDAWWASDEARALHCGAYVPLCKMIAKQAWLRGALAGVQSVHAAILTAQALHRAAKTTEEK